MLSWRLGESCRYSAPIVFEQPLEDFVGAHHARSTLTRDAIDAEAFDRPRLGLAFAMGGTAADGVLP